MNVTDPFSVAYVKNISANFTTTNALWGTTPLTNNSYNEIWFNFTINYTSLNTSNFAAQANFTYLNFPRGSYHLIGAYGSNNLNKSYTNESNGNISFTVSGTSEQIDFVVRSLGNLNYSTYQNASNEFYLFRHHNYTGPFWYYATVSATRSFVPDSQYVRYRVCTGTVTASNPPTCSQWSNPVNVLAASEGSNEVGGYYVNFLSGGGNPRNQYTINATSKSDFLLLTSIESGPSNPSPPSGGGGGGGGISPVLKNLSLRITPAEFVIVVAPQRGATSLEKRTYEICSRETQQVQLVPSFTGDYKSWATITDSPSGINVLVVDPALCTRLTVQYAIPASLKTGNYEIGLLLEDALLGKATAKTTVIAQPGLGAIQFFIDWLVKKVSWEISFDTQQAEMIVDTEKGISFKGLREGAIPATGLILGIITFTASFILLRRQRELATGRGIIPLFVSLALVFLLFYFLP